MIQTTSLGFISPPLSTPFLHLSFFIDCRGYSLSLGMLSGPSGGLSEFTAGDSTPQQKTTSKRTGFVCWWFFLGGIGCFSGLVFLCFQASLHSKVCSKLSPQSQQKYHSAGFEKRHSLLSGVVQRHNPTAKQKVLSTSCHD